MVKRVAMEGNEEASKKIQRVVMWNSIKVWRGLCVLWKAAQRLFIEMVITNIRKATQHLGPDLLYGVIKNIRSTGYIDPNKFIGKL